MRTPPLSSVVLVLDLDDTLYSEIDYCRSGRQHLIRTVCSAFPERSFDEAELLSTVPLENGRFDIRRLIERCKLPPSCHEQLLWLYRSHTPDIALSEATARWLNVAESRYAGVLILTDGRAITQRAKVRALGLSHLPILVSEEFGADKPDPVRFERAVIHHPADLHVYVGDNVAKDFLAPNRLGWLTIGLRADFDTVRREMPADVSASMQPSCWASSLSEVDDLVLQAHAVRTPAP